MLQASYLSLVARLPLLHGWFATPRRGWKRLLLRGRKHNYTPHLFFSSLIFISVGRAYRPRAPNMRECAQSEITHIVTQDAWYNARAQINTEQMICRGGMQIMVKDWVIKNFRANSYANPGTDLIASTERSLCDAINNGVCVSLMPRILYFGSLSLVHAWLSSYGLQTNRN